MIQDGKSLPEKYRFLLFDDDREVELVWSGKTQEVCNLVLPFQTIEHIDEPRSERITKDTQLNLFDTSGRQIRGWTNKLIWGDNKLILSSLRNGPMRQEKEIIRVLDPKAEGAREEWTGGFIFENEWQSFRTKKDRKLELVSAEKEVPKGRRKIAVKVVDIFGNDTTKVIEVNVA